MISYRFDIDNHSNELLQDLFNVWERSVRATHDFLTEGDIAAIAAYVPEALRLVPLLSIAEDDGKPVGFMGVEDDKLEMLFIDPDYRGCGIGRHMISHALERGISLVDVNEQNQQAVGFYRYLGYKVIARDELDSQGMPFPILHLQHPGA